MKQASVGGTYLGIRPGANVDINIRIILSVLLALYKFWDGARFYDSLVIKSHFVMVQRIFMNMTKIVHALKEESSHG